MAKQQYEHVGSVKHDVYRPKQKKKTDWSAIGGFFVFAFILLMIFS